MTRYTVTSTCGYRGEQWGRGFQCEAVVMATGGRKLVSVLLMGPAVRKDALRRRVTERAAMIVRELERGRDEDDVVAVIEALENGPASYRFKAYERLAHHGWDAMVGVHRRRYPLAVVGAES